MAEARPIGQFPVIPDKKCDLCDKNDIQWKCLNCNELMCDHCKIAHLRSKVSRDHKVVDLTGANVQPRKEISKCTEHASENLQMFCKSCDVPVCRRCITSQSHDSHSFELMEEMIDIKKRELFDITMKSKEKLSKYEQIVESVGDKQRVFSKKISQTIQDVKTRNTELKNHLDKITNDIVQQLQQLEKQDRQDNEKLERQLQIETADLKQLIQKCGEEQARRSINVRNFVSVMKMELCEYKPTEPPDIKNPPEFRTENVEEELKTLFGSLVKSTSKDCQLSPLQEQDRDQTRSVLTPKINAVVRSTFPAKNNTRVTAAEHGQSWIWKRSSRNLSLVKLDGQLVSDIKTDFKVFDVLVTRNGELLVTESCLLLRGKVKILTKDGNFTDIYSTTGYKTFGMTETDTGNVIVGLSSLVDGKFVEMTTEGTEMRTMKYDSIDNTKLFDYPYSISTNINGDIVVVDDYTKTVVIVDQGGHKKATYDAKNGNLTKPFHPRFIATDKLGQIFISDYENSVVHLLDKDGVFLEFLISDKNGCSEPFGLSIDSLGRLWVVNKGSNSVMIIEYM